MELDVSKATGPDKLPARILKECVTELILPIQMLIKNILKSGKWPQIWKLHHIVPIFKRKSPADPANYRGVHLTPVIAKVCERVLGFILCDYLDKTNAYGANQWAFRKGYSARDLVTVCTLEWILALND